MNFLMKITPSGLESSTLSNLGNMLNEFMPDWNVSYTTTLVPSDLREFFTEGSMFVRGTYVMRKYDKALFIHVDFKAPIEIYVIHQIGMRDVERRVYMVERSDSLAMFRIITTELEQITNGDFKNIKE